MKWGEVDGTIISEIFIWTRIHREGGGKRLFRIVTRGEVTEHLANLDFVDKPRHGWGYLREAG